MQSQVWFSDWTDETRSKDKDFGVGFEIDEQVQQMEHI